MWEFDGCKVDGHAAMLALTTARRQYDKDGSKPKGMFYRSFMEHCRTLSFCPAAIKGFLRHEKNLSDKLDLAELSTIDKLFAHVVGAEPSMRAMGVEVRVDRHKKLNRLILADNDKFELRVMDDTTCGLFAKRLIAVGTKIPFGTTVAGNLATRVKHRNPYVWSNDDMYCDPLDSTNKHDTNIGMFINYGDANANVELNTVPEAGGVLELTVIKPVECGEQLLWNYYNSDYPLPDWYIPTYGDHRPGLCLFDNLLVRLQFVTIGRKARVITCPDKTSVRFFRSGTTGQWASDSDWLLKPANCDSTHFFIQKGLEAYEQDKDDKTKWKKIEPDVFVTSLE
jgi:hypothetical protein